ncbi:MAG: hypothetical protein IJ191_08540 [Treponema sp.]|nr:hypothetical protein [Treponema sp.]
MAAAKKSQPPKWIVSDTLEAVYSSEAYISAIGWGMSQEEALVSADAGIGRYFQQSVNSLIVATQNAKNTSGVTASNERELQRQIVITSTAKLFAIQHTNPWYEESSQRYAVCAYIERKEAWKMYEPYLKTKVETFLGLYTNAKNQSDDFLSVILYSKADQYAQSNNLADIIMFGHALYPHGALYYNNVLENISLLPADIQRRATACSIVLICHADCDGLVSAAVSERFEELQFSVVQYETHYCCHILVAENKQELAAGIFYTPSVQITVQKEGDVLYSYSKTVPRTGARNTIVAQQRAYKALVQEIRASFLYWTE